MSRTGRGRTGEVGATAGSMTWMFEAFTSRATSVCFWRARTLSESFRLASTSRFRASYSERRRDRSRASALAASRAAPRLASWAAATSYSFCAARTRRRASRAIFCRVPSTWRRSRSTSGCSSRYPLASSWAPWRSRVGELGAERLDERAPDGVRQLLGVRGRAHLLVDRRLLQAARLRHGEGGAHVPELLLDEGASLFEAHQALVLLELLEDALRLLELPRLLGRLVRQPGPGLRRDAVAELEGLLDVGLDEGVGGLLGQRGTEGLEGHGHHLAVLDGLDAEPLLEAVDGAPPELRVIVEAEALDDAAGEEPALQEPELGLVVVLGRALAGPGVLVEVEDVRQLPLDEDLRPRLVDGPDQGRARRDRPDDDREHGEGQEAAAQKHVPVVAQVDAVQGAPSSRGRVSRGTKHTRGKSRARGTHGGRRGPRVRDGLLSSPCKHMLRRAERAAVEAAQWSERRPAVRRLEVVTLAVAAL